MLAEVTASHHQPLISYRFDIFVTVNIRQKEEIYQVKRFIVKKRKKEGDHSINISLVLICSSLQYLYIPIYYLWPKSEVHQP